jgi:TonB family protein
MTTKPPHLARLLIRLIPPPDREFIEGDLEEEFARRAARGGFRAGSWYWREALATVPWFAGSSLQRLRRAVTTSDLPRRALAMAVYLGTPAPTPRTPAFGSRLIASRPIRQEGIFRNGMMSMLCHVAFLGSLIYSTVGNAVEPPPPEVQILTTYRESVEDPTQPPPEPDEVAPEEVEIDVFTVPPEIPPVIPPPGQTRIDPDELYRELLREVQDTTDDRASDEPVGIGERPTFTPFEVAPRMTNREEVGRALEREYPALLRDAGIGGTVEVWFHLDERGVVQDVQVNAGSGQPSLDEAALRVARIVEFSPALNRDRPVPVWVSIPITFQTR